MIFFAASLATSTAMSRSAEATLPPSLTAIFLNLVAATFVFGVSRARSGRSATRISLSDASISSDSSINSLAATSFDWVHGYGLPQSSQNDGHVYGGTASLAIHDTRGSPLIGD